MGGPLLLLPPLPPTGVKTMLGQWEPGRFINFFSLHPRQLSLTPEVLTL